MDPTAIGVRLRQHLLPDFLREARRLHSYVSFGSAFDRIRRATKGVSHTAAFPVNRRQSRLTSTSSGFPHRIWRKRSRRVEHEAPVMEMAEAVDGRLGLGAWGLWLGDCGLWLVACGLWLVACGLWLVACGLWIVDCGLLIVDC